MYLVSPSWKYSIIIIIIDDDDNNSNSIFVQEERRLHELALNCLLGVCDNQ